MSSKKAEDSLRLEYLDGFRALAANWVLCAHIMIWGGWYGLPVPDPKIAVDLFMVLSGFLMVHVSESRERNAVIGFSFVQDFLCRRFFRIAPVYYVALIIACLLGGQIEEGCRDLQAANPRLWKGTVYDQLTLNQSWTSIGLHFTFLFGFFSGNYCSGLPDWSIALEVQFYVVLPLLLLLFRRIGPVASAVGIVWVGRESLNFFDPSLYPEPCFLPMKIDVLVGMLLNFCVRGLVNRSSDVLAQFLLAISIAYAHSTLLAGLCIALTICAVESPVAEPILRSLVWLVSRCLGNRTTRFLADMSYGVYLFHGIFISIVGGYIVRHEVLTDLRPVFRTAILGGVTVILTYAVAWPVHRFIEVPSIHLGRKLLRGRRHLESSKLKEAI